MENALLPEEEGNGQRSDAVLFCGHTSDTPAELPKDPERRLVSEVSVFVIVGGIAYQIERTGESHCASATAKTGIGKCPLKLLCRDGDSMTRFYCTGGGEGCFKMPLLLQGRVQKVLWQLVLKPPLQPIQVSLPFQILGIDIIDLQLTDSHAGPFYQVAVRVSGS